MEYSNRFKEQLLQRGESPPLGTWTMTASESCAEALGYVGFDFVVLDMEHVPIDAPQAISILRALAATPLGNDCTLVRLPWNDPIVVKRMLDAGAKTLMFPFIQNAKEAEQAVLSCRYPQNNGGTRGVAAVHRASHYGLRPDYLKYAANELTVILQIETSHALDNFESIAQVNGVDAVFVGPGDISANMGYLGQVGHPEVQDLLKSIPERSHALGKPCGIVGATPEMVRRYIEWGYDFVAIASDMSMLLAKAKEQISTVRNVTLQEESSSTGVY